MKTLVLICKIIFILSFSNIHAEIIEVDNKKIIKLIKRGVPLIDIRTEKEWQKTGIIKNSKTKTFFDEDGNYDIKLWMNDIKKIAKKNDPLIIICRSGRRSRIVANYLNSKAGYTNIYHATNGILSWISDNKQTIIPEL